MAKAIDNDDSVKIISLAYGQNITVNCFDPKFGTSLLDLSIINNKKKAFHALLQANVDVNARSPKDSSTALYKLCSYSNLSDNTLFYIIELMQHGADANIFVPDSLENKPIFNTCLEQLVKRSRSIDPIKYLIDHGARLDIYPRLGANSIFNKAILNSDLRVTKYLLMEKRINIPKYISIRGKGTSQTDTLTLRKVLIERNLTDYPQQQKIKEEILAFLAEHGQ